MRNIEGSTVCVVGGAGFLGSHLVRYLLREKNCQVIILDNLITGRREFIPKKAVFEYGDITGSESHLLKIFQAYSVDYVFNYAAEPYIPVSFERPLHVFDINAFGALKVINAAHEAGCKAILQVSSAEIYGSGNLNCPRENQQEGKICEQCPVAPHSTYGAAKAAIDNLVQVRWKEAGVQVISLRQFNCVGERETHPYVIPEIISQLYSTESGKLRLGNNSFRDFQYAGDAVAMAVELLEEGDFGEVYNMGSESGIKIYPLAGLIAEIAEIPFPGIEVDPARVRPWEIWHLQSDNTKLYSKITKRSTTSLRDAIELTLEYYEACDLRWPWEGTLY